MENAGGNPYWRCFATSSMVEVLMEVSELVLCMCVHGYAAWWRRTTSTRVGGTDLSPCIAQNQNLKFLPS